MGRGRRPLTLEDFSPATLERNRAVLQAAGFALAPPPPPRKTVQPATTRQATPAVPRALLQMEGQLLGRIQPIARDNGWIAWHTYVALGHDYGLHLTFIRDVVIYADLLDEGMVPTVSQQQLKQTLEAIASPDIETYCWYPRDFPAIEARLTQPRR